MGQFRKKPVVIEAVQYLGIVNPAGEVAFTESPDWLSAALALQPGPGAIWVRDDGVLMVGTLESPHEASVNDWIARGIKGELYPIKPEIFAELYDPAGDEPTYTITDAQWGQVNNALLAAIGVTSVYAKEVHQQMLDASYLMDELVNGPDDDA